MEGAIMGWDDFSEDSLLWVALAAASVPHVFCGEDSQAGGPVKRGRAARGERPGVSGSGKAALPCMGPLAYWEDLFKPRMWGGAGTPQGGGAVDGASR